MLQPAGFRSLHVWDRQRWRRDGRCRFEAARRRPLQLGKLIYLYDNNRVTLSAGTGITFTEDCLRRFEAYGWHTLSIDDGNGSRHRARLLQARRKHASIADCGAHTYWLRSPHKQDTFEAHGSPLGEECA